MRLTARPWCFLLLVGTYASCSWAEAASQAQQECDALAADPYDRSRPGGVTGVSLQDIDAPAAEAACQLAIEDRPPSRTYYQFGRALQAGHKDAEAVTNYRRAADQGYAAAQNNLGLMYENGRGVTKDDAQAAILYRKAAEQGYAVAEAILGMMYENGRDVAKDDAQAVIWYRKAADQGETVAQTNLGLMYANGRGVAKDDAQAVLWLREAAEHRDARAQSGLAWMYQNGRGVAKDDAQAMLWYRKAADQGDAGAQSRLAWMYANGRGVAKDDAQAAIWYRKAADQGDADAQFNLGEMYENGRGVTKDDAQAALWFRKAADQGYSLAQHNLAVLSANSRSHSAAGSPSFASLTGQAYVFVCHALGGQNSNGMIVSIDQDNRTFKMEETTGYSHTSCTTLYRDGAYGIPFVGPTAQYCGLATGGKTHQQVAITSASATVEAYNDQGGRVVITLGFRDGILRTSNGDSAECHAAHGR